MSARARPPPALEPYLRLPPEASLILLTGTLGCSVGWLAARFAGAVLTRSGAAAATVAEEPPAAVVLVSWMRDRAFWTTEVWRATGLDVAKLSAAGRFAFVNCFVEGAAGRRSPGSSPAPLVDDLGTLVGEAIARVRQQLGPATRIVLLLDNPDVLLALGAVTARELNQLSLRLRRLVHCAAMVCSADAPLLEAAIVPREGQPTPIEVETAAFVVQQAHQARIVMGVRELDTGAARDVSGVLRITRGGDSYTWDDELEEDAVKPLEALYLVGRDGGVKVFERGSGDL